MTFKHVILAAALAGAGAIGAQDKAADKPLTPEQFMNKVNAYLREQDAAVTEEIKSIRDALQKTSADVDLQTKTIAGLREKVKELQQELSKIQLENVKLKKEGAKQASKQTELLGAERKARAAGDLKLAAQLAAIIKKINGSIQDSHPGADKPTAGTTRNYVVRGGDTLGAIAKVFDTSVAKIKAANGLTSNTIRVGQKLVIPGAE